MPNPEVAVNDRLQRPFFEQKRALQSLMQPSLTRVVLPLCYA